jgi:hypothetical protein
MSCLSWRWSMPKTAMRPFVCHLGKVSGRSWQETNHHGLDQSYEAQYSMKRRTLGWRNTGRLQGRLSFSHLCSQIEKTVRWGIHEKEKAAEV